MILVQTTDDKRDVWPAWFHYFNRYRGEYRGRVMIANETIDVAEVVRNALGSWDESVEVFNSGTGVWFSRMRRILEVCDEPIWYVHEDFFLRAPINLPIMRYLEDYMRDYECPLIKACGKTAGALGTPKLIATDEPDMEVYDNSNGYLVSHQVSLWDPDFFKSTVIDGYTPWDHEMKGTEVVRRARLRLMAWTGRQPLPYRETLRGQRFRPGGREMFQEAVDQNPFYEYPPCSSPKSQ